MHENYFMKDALKIVADQASQNGLKQVTKIRVGLSVLSHHSAEALQGAFDRQKNDYPILSGAELEVNERPNQLEEFVLEGMEGED